MILKKVETPFSDLCDLLFGPLFTCLALAIFTIYRFRVSTTNSGLGPVKYNNFHVVLKGQSHEIFVLGFFPQTAPPGPIRDVLGPFRFFFCFLAEL